MTFEQIRDSVFTLTKIPNAQLRIRLKQVANFDRSGDDGTLQCNTEKKLRLL